AGSATGIGAVTARLMAGEGATVILADVDEQKAQALADEIRAGGAEASAVYFDAGDAESVERMVAVAADRHGRIDVLHANVANFRPEVIGGDSEHDVVDLPLEVWDATLRVGLTGLMLCCKHAIPKMLDGGGTIVVTSSVAGIAAEPV